MWLCVCLKYNILIFTVTSNGDSLKIIQILDSGNESLYSRDSEQQGKKTESCQVRLMLRLHKN